MAVVKLCAELNMFCCDILILYLFFNFNAVPSGQNPAKLSNGKAIEGSGEPARGAVCPDWVIAISKQLTQFSSL